jgi:hypothetical protein
MIETHGKAHGKEYRIRLLKVDGTDHYSDWFPTHDTGMEALARAAKVDKCKYFMQSKNVFLLGESGDPEITEYRITIYDPHTA